MIERGPVGDQGRQFVAQRRMRPFVVVELAPPLDDDFGFSGGEKPLPVRAFAAEFVMEAFQETVLPGLTRLDEGGADVGIAQPLHHRSGGEFSAIVRADKRRLVAFGRPVLAVPVSCIAPNKGRIAPV